MDERNSRLVQSICTGGKPPPSDTGRGFYCRIPGNPPVQGWQRQALAHTDNIASAACRVWLCSLQLNGRRNRTEQGQLLPRTAPYSANHTQGGAELGSVAGLFPENDGQAERQPGRKGETGTGASRVIARTFSPDTGTGENAWRDHRQGNRRFDRRQPQHHQGASEKARRAALDRKS